MESKKLGYLISPPDNHPQHKFNRSLCLIGQTTPRTPESSEQKNVSENSMVGTALTMSLMSTLCHDSLGMPSGLGSCGTEDPTVYTQSE